jgi:signal transduction histidine kinase
MKIKHKLTAIIMLTSVVALMLGLMAFVVWEYFDIKTQMVANLFTHASIVADNSRAAVAFDDAKGAQNILNALRASPSITHAHIVKADGNSFASYNLDPNDQSVHILDLRGNNYAFSGNALNLKQDIIQDGEKIGTIYLQAGLGELHSGIMKIAYIGLMIAVIVIFVTYLLSSRLQKIISGPILRLAITAKDVSENKDYSTRAIKHSNDEVGLLIEAFNEMLFEIQQRDTELREINEKLEIRVKERTADLVIANQQLEELNTELKSTISKLTTANRELSDFAHVAAHDLKAPLRAIGSLAGIMHEDYNEQLDEQGKKYLELLVRRTERMSELINAILRYSEVGKVFGEKEKVDLNKTISEVIGSLAVPENIEIIVETQLPVIVVEKSRIAQVFQNLINNSVKYMDKPNGIIKIGCVENGEEWKFYVADNGPGIEEKYFDKIFTIFQTLKRRDELESSGIGLSMVKKIIEIHGGKVWVESKITDGSTFYFTWPKNNLEINQNEKLKTDYACRR